MFRIPIEHAQKRTKISCNFGRVLVPSTNCKLQYRTLHFQSKQFQASPALILYSCPVCALSEEKRFTEAFYLGEKETHKKPLCVFNCAHPGVIASAGRYEKPSTLCANIQNIEDTNLEQEQWHHVRVHTDTHPHESTNILHPLHVL